MGNGSLEDLIPNPRIEERISRYPIEGCLPRALKVERITTTKYRLHRFDINMTQVESKLEHFLDSLGGEVVTVIPNVIWIP